MSVIHYKFRSSNNNETLTFDGLSISLQDLKNAIIQKKNFSKLDRDKFDLQISDPITQQPYKNDDMIHKNASVIVARVPVERTARGPKRWNQEIKDFAVPTMSTRATKESISAAEKIKEPELFKLEASEEEKIEMMKKQSSITFDPSTYVTKPRFNPTGQPHRTYLCRICNRPGHWVNSCPHKNDPNMQAPKVLKPSTGIPSLFMKTVTDPNTPGALMTAHGTLAVPIVNAEAYAAGKKEKPPFVKSDSPDPLDEGREVPNELLCPICKDIIRDAVVIPCCGNSFCDECVRQALLDSDDHVCPNCHQSNVSPDGLVSNKYLRTVVNNFINENNYVPAAPVKKPASPPPQQPPATREQQPPAPSFSVEKLPPASTTAAPVMTAASAAGVPAMSVGVEQTHSSAPQTMQLPQVIQSHSAPSLLNHPTIITRPMEIRPMTQIPPGVRFISPGQPLPRGVVITRVTRPELLLPPHSSIGPPPLVHNTSASSLPLPLQQLPPVVSGLPQLLPHQPGLPPLINASGQFILQPPLGHPPLLPGQRPPVLPPPPGFGMLPQADLLRMHPPPGFPPMLQAPPLLPPSSAPQPGMPLTEKEFYEQQNRLKDRRDLQPNGTHKAGEQSNESKNMLPSRSRSHSRSRLRSLSKTPVSRRSYGSYQKKSRSGSRPVRSRSRQERSRSRPIRSRSRPRRSGSPRLRSGSRPMRSRSRQMRSRSRSMRSRSRPMRSRSRSFKRNSPPRGPQRSSPVRYHSPGQFRPGSPRRSRTRSFTPYRKSYERHSPPRPFNNQSPYKWRRSPSPRRSPFRGSPYRRSPPRQSPPRQSPRRYDGWSPRRHAERSITPRRSDMGYRSPVKRYSPYRRSRSRSYRRSRSRSWYNNASGGYNERQQHWSPARRRTRSRSPLRRRSRSNERRYADQRRSRSGRGNSARGDTKYRSSYSRDEPRKPEMRFLDPNSVDPSKVDPKEMAEYYRKCQEYFVSLDKSGKHRSPERRKEETKSYQRSDDVRRDREGEREKYGSGKERQKYSPGKEREREKYGSGKDKEKYSPGREKEREREKYGKEKEKYSPGKEKGKYSSSKDKENHSSGHREREAEKVKESERASGTDHNKHSSSNLKRTNSKQDKSESKSDGKKSSKKSEKTSDDQPREKKRDEAKQSHDHSKDKTSHSKQDVDDKTDMKGDNTKVIVNDSSHRDNKDRSLVENKNIETKPEKISVEKNTENVVNTVDAKLSNNAEKMKESGRKLSTSTSLSSGVSAKQPVTATTDKPRHSHKSSKDAAQKKSAAAALAKSKTNKSDVTAENSKPVASTIEKMEALLPAKSKSDSFVMKEENRVVLPVSKWDKDSNADVSDRYMNYDTKDEETKQSTISKEVIESAEIALLHKQRAPPSSVKSTVVSSVVHSATAETSGHKSKSSKHSMRRQDSNSSHKSHKSRKEEKNRDTGFELDVKSKSADKVKDRKVSLMDEEGFEPDYDEEGSASEKEEKNITGEVPGKRRKRSSSGKHRESDGDDSKEGKRKHKKKKSKKSKKAKKSKHEDKEEDKS